MPDNPLNAVIRGVYINDNLPFLLSLKTSASTWSASTHRSPRTKPPVAAVSQIATNRRPNQLLNGTESFFQ